MIYIVNFIQLAIYFMMTCHYNISRFLFINISQDNMQADSLQHLHKQLIIIEEGKFIGNIKQLHKNDQQSLYQLKNHYESLQKEMESQRQEIRSLKKKNRKLALKYQKREEQCQILKRQMIRNKDIYQHKVNKMTKQLEKRLEQTYYGPIRQKNGAKSKNYKNVDTQCDIFDSSIIKKLQQNNLLLFNRINFLEKKLQDEENENNSKQLYIESLLKALKEQEDQQKDSQQENTSEDQLSQENQMNNNIQKNQDSTIDALSDKGSDVLSVLSDPDLIVQEAECQYLNKKQESLIYYWFEQLKSTMMKPLKYILPL